ncbi:hydroxymethylglutaryl-CoA lyase [Parapedomonas caeni]
MSNSPVQIVEVGARDGLQNEPEVIGTADKVALLTRMMDAGVRRLEVASFVHPQKVPQMADAEAVIAALPDRPDVSYIGLCLNKRGVMRALATREGGKRGVDEAGCVVVASDTFGMRNQGQTIEDGVRENQEMLKLARANGLVPQVTISAAFGCPFEGEVPADRVLDIIKRMADAEPDEIAIADTIGVGVPGQVEELFGRARALLPAGIKLRAHFHNTRNTGIANAWAAYKAGASVLDASVGGLGGCPFAPRATGNIATEDLLYMLDRSSVPTGVDLDAVIATALWFEGVRGKPAVSMVAKAGGFPRVPAAAVCA